MQKEKGKEKQRKRQGRERGQFFMSWGNNFSAKLIWEILRTLKRENTLSAVSSLHLVAQLSFR